MFQHSLIADRHVEPLADSVLTVLERVGILCQNRRTLEALAEAGAVVSHDDERATFPRRTTAAFVEALRVGSAGTSAAPQRIAPPWAPTLEMQVAQYCHHYPSRSRRPGARDDFVRLVRFGSALHPEQGVGHALLLTDVPPLMEPLEAGLLLAEYGSMPWSPFAWNVRQIDYLREMGEALGRSDWGADGAICIAHPLRFDRDVADRFARRALEGRPTGLTAMPVAGATTPVTVEGFIVVSAAEHVAAWMAARALNPRVPLAGSMWPGTVDMKTGAVSFSAPDALFRGFASVEFLRRWTGVEVAIGGGEYCASTEPGLAAALEKAHKAMAIAAFQGHHPPIGQGMLDDGKVISPVQLLVERDLSAAIGHLAGEVQPTPDSIGLASILDVGLGLHASHVQTEHTLRHFRGSLWLPGLLDRLGWRGPDAERQMLDRAQARVEELEAAYRKPEGREDQLAAMRRIAARARRDLIGS